MKRLKGQLKDELTAREHEVIDLISQGLNDKECGLELGITEHGITHHLKSIYRKLGLNRRIDLILWAAGFKR